MTAHSPPRPGQIALPGLRPHGGRRLLWALVGTHRRPAYVERCLRQDAKGALAKLRHALWAELKGGAPCPPGIVAAAARRCNEAFQGSGMRGALWHLSYDGYPAPLARPSLDVPAQWGVEIAYLDLQAREQELANGWPPRFQGEARAVKGTVILASELSDLLEAATGFSGASGHAPTAEQLSRAWRRFDSAAERAGAGPEAVILRVVAGATGLPHAA
jgi:hypothetical protein